MATWLNHVTIAGPRNAATTHTVTPSAGTVVAGTLFTPTAGRLLVCVVEGAVTSTTPSGWTLPANGSAVDNSGLYVWYRTAAGSDSLTTTHNAADYPAIFDIYEFPTGSTFKGSATAIGVSNQGGAGPTLSGLTGTNWVAGALGNDVSGTTGSQAVTWSTGVKATDTIALALALGTDGYLYSLAYLEDSVASSVSLAATTAGDATMPSGAERLVFAVAVASSGAVTTTGVCATSTALARPPVVSGGATGVSVTAVRASGVGSFEIPAIDVIVTLTGGGPATGSVVMRPPTVTAASGGTVAAVRATGTALAPAPMATATITGAVQAIQATGSSLSPAPAVTGSSVGIVAAVRATSAGLAIPPATWVTQPATVTATRAVALGQARPGNPTGGTVTSLPAAVTFGSVKGWIATGVNVAPDLDGYADMVAAVGTITFTPVKAVVLIPAASPAPLVLAPKPVVATLDSEGYLIGTKTAEKLVRLIIGQWKVTSALVGITIPEFTVTIVSNTILDLAEVIPT